MSNINTGEPAFPCDEIVDKYGSVFRSSGMTLRDYFAAKAMHALYTSVYEYEFTGKAREPESIALMDELAQDAYQIADSMLKAREA